MIDKALGLEREERQALEDLRKAVESLKSDTVVYKTLLNAVENEINPNPNSCPPFQRWVTGL